MNFSLYDVGSGTLIFVLDYLSEKSEKSMAKFQSYSYMDLVGYEDKYCYTTDHRT